MKKIKKYIRMYRWMNVIPSGIQRELYALLYALGGSKAEGACVSVQYLADWLGIKPRWTSAQLKELQQAGLLHVEYISGSKSIFRTTTPAQSCTPLYTIYNTQIKGQNNSVVDNATTHAKKASQKKSFQKPSYKQVQDYFITKGGEQYAERFFDYYTSNGWRVGKNSMKDWQAAARNWMRQETQYNYGTKINRRGYRQDKGLATDTAIISGINAANTERNMQ